ncbi:non-ribosomal peptide synthetase [Streptomyces sp. DH37]|uniref:non-ribosomal peptide synthetase n=1 Tax=Streptomyces sp. DH37 TaxID=3040122 RepID=UPI0024424904|nr:non-ribosomal peptide synthetase [Streptomyces sp. DH37]MDG9701462.1 amino acid adenylation domain-containing protein [Streptomyces sp. DH37]
MTAGAAPHGARNGDDTPKASFAQRRLWFLDQLAEDSSDSLLPLALRIRGPLDVPALERALTGIVDRHEVLRTRFAAADGEPALLVDGPGGAVLEHTEAGSAEELFARELARPLDLATRYPLRMTLARLAPDEHLLLLVVHHIAVDGWSWDVLLRELAAGYRGETVPPPALQYADFARAQAERLSGPRMERLLGYWRDRLRGTAPLDLPTDRPRPRFWDGSGDVVRFTLPADLVAGVDRVAREHRATRYMLLLAVYQALLARRTGRTDIAVCTTLADRGHAGTADLIGPFVNTVVLRTDLSGEPSFGGLLERVRANVLKDLSHADAPFDHVVRAVGGERDLSRHPLAQASFTLLNTAHRPVHLPGLDVELVAPPLNGTTMDVFLDLGLRPDGGIAARLQYATALFDAETMRGFASAYTGLLRAVLDEPRTPVGELARRLDPLPDTAEARPEARWSRAPDRPAAPAPAVAAAGEPDAPALVCADRTVSYAELDGLTGGLASALAGAGAGRGSAVGVLLRRGIGSVAAMLAVWRAGGAYVPLDPELPAERLRFMVDEARVGCVVADAATAERAAALGTAVVRADTAAPDPGGPRHVPDPHDLAHVIFTSGSTGRPKAVGVEHRALASHVAAARGRYGITADDRVLAFSSFSFDASLDQVLPALSCGARVIVRPDEPWLPTQVPEVVERHGVTVVNVPPTYWNELAFSLDRRAAARLATLRLLILGGESVPAGALAAWRAAVPHARVCNAYGPTETTVTSTTYEITGPVDGRVPIGRPLGSRRVYVVDAQGEPVGVGVPGELLIGGPELARGYLGRPGLTAERFVPDPFGSGGGRLYRTGDVVRWLPSGDLEFLGRSDDQVKIRGFRVELGEVEAVLRGSPGVAAAAVRPDTATGQTLVGYVVTGTAGTTDAAATDAADDAADAGAGPGAADPAALRAWCAERLPHYAVPSDIVLLDALPVNASGKLDRAALPDARPDRAAGGAAYTAPRDESERIIAAVWADVLGVERVGIDDGFFDLGGHSLLATMAVSRVAERLGRDVELRTLFENPRIREFGPAVAAARQAAGAAVTPVDRSGPLPMSFAQERLWFLDRASEAGDEYVLWFSWRIRGGLDRAAWQAALDDLTARHEVLRTALVEVDGRPAQQVCDPAAVPLEWRHVPEGGDGAARLDAVREQAHALATRRFDLDRPPMLRAGVWELGPRDHVAVLAFHHVATDGWSKDVFTEELAACYRARLAGRAPVLPELPVQYGDFAVWQRDRAEDGALEEELDYWEEELRDLPVLRLPTDRPRPTAWSGRGGAVEVGLPPGLADRLDAFAREHGATRFMVLLAAVQTVLARWSGQHDVPVGTPVAGRGRTELERLVGFFVNTVVLRGDLSGAPTFADLLGRVRATVLGAFDHQDVPFEKLVERLRPERDLSRNPLFQVMVDVQESAAAGPRVEGLEVTGFALPWASAKFDLTTTFLLYPDRFALNVEYAADLFDAATATRLAEHVARVLTAVLADPDIPVDRVDLLSPAERAHLVAAAGADRPAPEAPPFAVAGEPDAPALVCEDRTVSYAELDGLTGGLASALAGAGADRGSPVGVCLRRGTGSVAAMLAVWRAGGVYVPLDPRLPAERLRFMAAEAGVRCAIGDASTAAGLAALGVPVVRADEVRSAPDAPRRTPGPHDLAYTIFTSGSTGLPKAVGVEHHALDAHVAAARELFAVTARDRVLTFASFSFDASLEQILPALSAGATVVIRPDEVWSVEELAARVRAERVTVMELTPSYWEEVVARLETVAGDLASLRLLVTGGEELPSGPLERWFAHLPHVPVVNTYGPTESVVSATAHPVTGPVDGRVPIGRPLGSRRAYVVDPHGNLAPLGVPGELLIGGPELARGYLGRAARTAERFVPDPFGSGGRLYRTGDVVRRLPSGDLEFTGRSDDQVKIRGFRVEPGETEAALRRHPGVHAAAVVVRELRGERALVGYVAGRGLDHGDLAAHCRARLPGYQVPAAFVLLDALPLTVQGKLDTAALPDPEPPAPAEHTPPRTPTETVTAQIWAEVLGVPRVGVHDDFFALGGHSLRAVAAASRLRAAFDCPIQVRDLFEHPTVELLAAEVERQLVELISAMSDDEIDLSLTVDHQD